MPKNEDGEFELILGNRQLLTVFFIVVILLGVFFAMGYIVGKNSPAPVTEAANTRKTDVKPLVVESSSKPAEAAPVPKETAPQQPAADTVKSDDTQAKEKEAKAAKAREDADAKARAAEEERARKEERARAKKEAKEAAAKDAAAKEGKDKSKKESAKAERAKPALGSPSGTYLQLAATTQHEAEALVDMLRKKDFSAITAEIPEKPGTFRVLVGPLSEGSLSRSRTDLQEKGFPGDKAIKRSF
jgi:flagellar biosynthesis GTPase FlhF